MRFILRPFQPGMKMAGKYSFPACVSSVESCVVGLPRFLRLHRLDQRLNELAPILNPNTIPIELIRDQPGEHLILFRASVIPLFPAFPVPCPVAFLPTFLTAIRDR